MSISIFFHDAKLKDATFYKKSDSVNSRTYASVQLQDKDGNDANIFMEDPKVLREIARELLFLAEQMDIDLNEQAKEQKAQKGAEHSAGIAF
jgi:hypothetical protein